MSETPSAALKHFRKAQFDFATTGKLPLLTNNNTFLADIVVRYARLRVSRLVGYASSRERSTN